MQGIDKNKTIVEKMIKYCDKILNIKEEKELTKEKYMDDEIAQLAIDMCIFQLSELSVHIDEDFKLKHLNIAWAEIRGMRNIQAHEYEKVDREVIWDTIDKDIDILKEQLVKIM